MTFQQKINIEQGFGVPGDIHLDSPMRAESLVMNSEGSQKTLLVTLSLKTLQPMRQK